MKEISTELIKQAVYKLCFEANTCLNKDVYNLLYTSYLNAAGENRNILLSILKNAQIAFEKKMPLCQDTGQVIVFLEIGQDVHISGGNLENGINEAVEKCYKDNFFRKSVVKNSVFDRNNTKTNTPAIIYTDIVEGDTLGIKVLIKGAGSENKSKLLMALPTASENELVEAIGKLILEAGVNACPPMFIGVGIGSTSEGAMLLSKKALLKSDFSQNESELAAKIKDYVNRNSKTIYKNNYVLAVKLLTQATHIACMPVGITINCHSDRYSSCIINDKGIEYFHEIPDFKITDDYETALKEVMADDTEAIKSLEQGEKVLLSGEIYVARDMAHKKLKQMLDKNEVLPFDMKDKIIFYAGPCPESPNKVIGSIGPTTSSRMDKYAVEFYDKGLLATIGKGSRNTEVESAIKRNGAKYFTVTGGIAALLSQKVISKEIIAFEELGAEALLKICVKKIPVIVEIA